MSKVPIFKCPICGTHAPSDRELCEGRWQPSRLGYERFVPHEPTKRLLTWLEEGAPWPAGSAESFR